MWLPIRQFRQTVDIATDVSEKDWSEEDTQADTLVSLWQWKLGYTGREDRASSWCGCGCSLISNGSTDSHPALRTERPTLHASITYLLTPWSRVLLEKLTGLQLVKKFPAFYGTRRIINAFTSARRLSLSRASSIQSIPPTSHFLKFRLDIILPSMPGSPQWSLHASVIFLTSLTFYITVLNWTKNYTRLQIFIVVILILGYAL
jgi:hypothetical protein